MNAGDSGNVETAKRYMMAGLSGNDFSAYRQIFDDKFVNHQGKNTSIESMEKVISMIGQSFPDLTPKFEDVIEDGNKVVIRTRLKGHYTGKQIGTYVPKGQVVEFHSIDIFEFADTKIVAHWGEDSSAGIISQIK
jgi:predicted ester cyclase